MQQLVSLAPMLLIIVVFYFLLIRPEKKRNKQIAEMRDSLKKGDEIISIGGIVGKITNIKEDMITIETGSDRNKVRLMRWAVSSVVNKSEEKPAEVVAEVVEESNEQ